MSGRGKGEPWTDQARRLLVQWTKDGADRKALAKYFNRSEDAIRRQQQKLGLLRQEKKPVYPLEITTTSYVACQTEDWPEDMPAFEDHPLANAKIAYSGNTGRPVMGVWR